MINARVTSWQTTLRRHGDGSVVYHHAALPVGIPCVLDTPSARLVESLQARAIEAAHTVTIAAGALQKARIMPGGASGGWPGPAVNDRLVLRVPSGIGQTTRVGLRITATLGAAMIGAGSIAASYRFACVPDAEAIAMADAEGGA